MSRDRFRPGDRDDFDRLYRETYPRIRFTLQTMLRDAAAAEDCAQEAFVRAFRAWSRDRTESIAALRRLRPQHAAVLVLRHYHGYSNREIASALGVPESTVSSQLIAARRRLAETLGEPAQRVGPEVPGPAVR